MPLVRVELRNEYGLGAPEMYSLANKEDPKDVLEGVAVAGLVGILRQLGDLAEFAADMFHGLQEHVMITSSRSHKLMGRVKQIEAALPPLEKLVLAQRSHLHFAYTSGANWHVRRRCEQNHFIYGDLPRCIQDSYEQCKGPPRLNLLDKFDPGGPGSCLKRYSDPSFFRRASIGSEVAYSDKILKDKKGRKIKKKSSWRKHGEVSRGTSMSNQCRRMQFASLNVDGHSSPSQTVSTHDAVKSDIGDQKTSLDFGNGSVDFECASYPRSSVQHEEQEFKESSSSSSRIQNNDSSDYAFIDEKGSTLFDDSRGSLSVEQAARHSFSVTWNEKEEMLEPTSEEYVQNGISETVCGNFILDNEEKQPDHSETGEGYTCEMSLEDFTNIDLENVDGDIYLKTDEGRGCEMSMESFSTNIDLANVNGATHFEIGKGYDHDHSSLTYSGTIDQETEIGDTHSETAKVYGHDEPLKTFSGVLDLDMNDRGANEFGTAVKHDHNESFGMFSANLDQETEDSEAVLLETANEMDIKYGNENVSMLGSIQPDDFKRENAVQRNFHLDCENLPISTSTALQHEDVESETDQDHYVDALNTIESEYETDLDSQTKQVEHDSDTESKVINHEVDMFIKSNFETHIASSSSPKNNPFEEGSNSVLPETFSVLYDCPDNVKSKDISSLDPYESHVLPPVEIATESSTSNCQSACDILQNCDALGSPNIESVINVLSPSNSRQHNASVSVTGMITCSPELQKPPPEPSSNNSIKFWTNGGLLGLEPSKPPDFTLPNSSTQVSLLRKDYEVNTPIGKPDTRDKRHENIEEGPNMECSTSSQGDRKGGILTKKASWTSLSADLSLNLQKLSDPCNSSPQKDCYSSKCGTVQPVAPDRNSSMASQVKNGNSSRMFELGNRLLQNGFYQKSVLDRDETSNRTSSYNDGPFVLKGSHRHRHESSKTFSGKSKDLLGNRSPILSPSSSPPLGHMKMSFKPLNGLEVPKLQLKFPDGNVNHEEVGDFFPSFQLIPETTVPLQDVGSDSDDDTFCRSSPYESDCPGHESDTNSEQWESSDSPRSKDQELYDALCRVSLTESASTSWQTGESTQGERNKVCGGQNSFSRYGLEHSQSGHLFDLPGLDSIHSSLEEEWRNQCHPKDHDDPHSLKELTPSPPPLPPSEWRATKLPTELAEDKQVPMTENLSHEFDWKLGNSITHQPKPAPFKQEQIIEATQTLKSKDLREMKLEKDVYLGANKKELEEKEDFLHQIRTKSFSLRRTDATRPVIPTGTPTNFQVTAILRKANAIRQAVGSDDGEDDNWSDA